MKPVLKVYNFSYYLGETTIADFEKECGCRVIYDNYASNEEMIAKIKTGARYDVIFPTDYAVDIMRRSNLLLEIDHGLLHNFKNLDPRFLNQGFDPGNRFSVPYHWGTCGLGYDSEVIPTPDSFEALWDPRYRNRISVLDDARFTVGMALKSLGFSANTTRLSELEAARRRLDELKENVRAFSSDTYIKMLADGEVVLAYGYSAGVLQAAADNSRIRYIVPASGTILWMDNLAIPRTAENRALALRFIDFILRPEVIAKISSHVKAANPNREAAALIAPETRNDKAVYPDEAVISRSEFLEDLGEQSDLYYELWTSMKAN
jgi:spermidine/putrescine-binding protein